MARIRTIKPDAFHSESLCEVPRGTRWTFAGLWTYADDKGRGRDDARLIKAALYPIDDDVTLEDVKTDLWLLAGIGAVCRYVVDERNYLHMPEWHHQKINRPTPAKSPPCPVHEDGVSGHVLDPEDSLNDHGALTEPSVGEGKGRERKGKGVMADKSADEPAPGFDEFWDTYAYKTKRVDAIRAWAKAVKKTEPEQIITAAAAYVDKINADREQRGERATAQAHAASWLNGERWNDDLGPQRQASVHHLPHARDIEQPPDGMSDQEYYDWYVKQHGGNV